LGSTFPIPARIPTRQSRLAEPVSRGFGRIIPIAGGDAGDDLRVSTVQLDDDEVLLARLLGIIGDRFHAVDDGIGCKALGRAKSSPLNDIVGLGRKHAAAGGKRVARQVRRAALELEVDPAAQVSAFMDDLISAKTGAEMLKVIDLRILLTRRILDNRHLLRVNPLFPASGLATGSLNGLNPKSKFLAIMAGCRSPSSCQSFLH